MTDHGEKLEIKLPARITGLVFWGLVFIGLLVAVIILQQMEKDLISSKKKNSIVLAYEVESIVEQYTESPVLIHAADEIRRKINDQVDDFDFNAVRLFDGEDSLSIGDIGDNDDVFEYSLHYFPSNIDKLSSIKVQIYSASVKATIAELRKQILLSIGLGVFIFGLFLQSVLQKMLSRPFQLMVNTAENFLKGDETSRFDEKRTDEFGYLGKFINNAIDTLLEQKNEISLALERASESELALGHEKERAEVTLRSITDTVVTVDVNECIVFVNPAGEKLLNCKNHECYGKQFGEVFKIVEEGSGEIISDPLHECFLTGEIVSLPEHSSLIKNDDEIVSIEASIAPMKHETGELLGAVIVVQDVSNTRRLTRQLTYQASHDLLTGLFNRRKFEENLEEVLINVREEKRHHSLIYLDLDNFKIVNDTCGHIAGDELLKQLPALFNEVLRSGDVIARLGGDEFGILLQNCELKQASSIANKIRQKIKDYRFIWEDRTFEIGVSIGVTGINEDNYAMSRLLSEADVACYAAKDSGRNRVHVYEPSDEAVNERYGQMHWTARISKALVENRFLLYQQPIVNVLNKNHHHYEILLRMVDEDENVIPPGAFMPAAERYGLMPEIDRWVIRETFKYIATDDPADPSKSADQVFAINLSGDSINDPKLLDYILEEKVKRGILLSNVCFEITETVAISNLTKATIFINELKEYGCRFSLDDFGSGLSSFAYLKSLPVDYLKIDGCFVKDISRDEIDRAMVEAIQQVGKVMNLDTIAEHVEDIETLRVLEEIGVDFVQGYHLGRPQSLLDK